ncbi:protein phosphatase 2C domain-containing protein [Kitasatospora sp. A2-31]|uniref:protein phosphatase 2C domain-containing protein n=1 Tax=Kitasatospora sp. A2-31 TaxID=2916414 RepID=UPI001EEADBEE|nr:protein phosphatase 2C domain-containing protein [Kitasatospora sp. A2-31]MCG6494898.1 protein phosphatase 2C domain-containing protein [Kitasatospora sp. A2-31]
MRVSIATAPGGLLPNEDWVAATPTLAMVLDGLSTVGLDTGCRHGVPWYVAQLGSHLVASLATPDCPLTDGLAKALDQVAALHPECDLSNPGTPSATVSVLRAGVDQFEYLVLADSPIVVERGGGYEVFTDLRVDTVVPELRAETERFTTGSPEHAESLRRMVTAQRLTRNTPGGYWVAASNGEAAHHALTGVMPLAGVEAVAVMSDGVSRLVTEYRAASWSEVFTTLRESGVEGLISSVRTIEATDPDGVRWPRYKASDDAAVAFCQAPWGLRNLTHKPQS